METKMEWVHNWPIGENMRNVYLAKKETKAVACDAILLSITLLIRVINSVSTT